MPIPINYLVLFLLLLCFTFSVTSTRIQPRLRPLTQNELNSQQLGQRRVAPSPREKLRPGPKLKPLEARIYRERGPIRKIRRTYNKRRKLEVILFLMHHRVPTTPEEIQYRRPTQKETSKFWKIPETTIQPWWSTQETIVNQKGTGRQQSAKWICQWPEMEKELFEIFLEERNKGRLIRQGWFQAQARQLFSKHYGGIPNMFVFSIGWFSGFLKRWSISCRVLTKISSRLPDEYECLVINWLRFNRRNSQPRNHYEQAGLISDIGRFRLSNILNLDETPIPFEYLDGKTYNVAGSKTVTGKTERSGWDKRQATLILYIFADGIARIRPKLIFHGTSGENIRQKEGHLWHTGITVEFNETAYNNEELFLDFIENELCPVLWNTHNPSTSQTTLPTYKPDTTLNHESLLLMDVAGFHTTETVLEKLHSAQITTSLIPSGCTGLLQPLDTAVNKPFKSFLREYTDTYIEIRSHSNPHEKWSTSDKRIMVTHVVAEAWAAFTSEKGELLRKSFRDLGVTLPLDGSKDDQIRIKGFQHINIGDWTKDLPLPLPLHPMESHRSLPLETTSHDALEFVWACKNYFHTPDENQSSTQTSPPPGGALLQF
ncbi:hypothetical protein L873DRAFT_1691456 [Choiromyces venosus 120613-1]|uniref:HTH CENPB-type domain-containing protein n=1 Tax=Choiromyces venosus 120613-1 TaxID=1336337 RepID=A0A3N4JG36_9PEZI|nr:hypothetical protein L873DRAFT_1691456 [Choiromyces venosus 120613-1]